ncbi:MAG: type II toxin-antitoxin system RelE family toxin [Hyalangium sp.]|uniref:type II toxin-antitoxin system RelE family toxin n=1 Tax=Hyalangium sp. TaxID=2028555 RepID=UPI00389A9BCF
MFRQHSRVAGAYRVTFSPEAWQEIGRLPSTTFQALQEALDQLAQQGRHEPLADETPSEITFTIDSLVISCERDDKTRTLTLRHVTGGAKSPDSGR